MKMYDIRGRHSTVYPVQLPTWSSPDVVRQLVERFDEHLHKQLEKMQQLHSFQEELRSRGHKHSPSSQSVISSITDGSNNSAESNVNDDAENTMAKMSNSNLFGNHR
jgi:hypothetical protein